MSVPIHIGIAFDRNYLNPFFALAASLKAHHEPGQLCLHCIATGIDESHREQILKFLGAHMEVKFYQIDERTVTDLTLTARWTSAVYYRLLFPFLIPAELTRFLYLDSDTLCTGNLTDLFSTVLQHPVAAARDTYVTTQPLLGITEAGKYFNSGVMLIDLNQWKARQISELTLEYLRNFPERIRYVDQCGLNAVLINQWQELPAAYNLMYSSILPEQSRSYYFEQLDSVKIIHFTLQRPWEFTCRNPYRFLYFQYLKASPAKDAAITDFTWHKVPEWLAIQIREWYFSHRWVRTLWRAFRRSAKLSVV